jgi:hypothetical protein
LIFVGNDSVPRKHTIKELLLDEMIASLDTTNPDR